MVQQKRSQRLNPVDQALSSSGNVPAPSTTRISLAGTTDRGVAAVGDVLNKIGLQQQATQDKLDADNLLISKEAEFNEALIEADKIADPGEYNKFINKRIASISSTKAKFGFFQDSRIGDQVRSKIEALKQAAIAKSLGRTSVKQHDKINANYLSQSNLITEQALIKGTPEAIANAKLQHEEQANNALLSGASNQEDTVKRIQAFNEGLSMQGFLKAAEADPKGVNAKADDFTKAFGLTQEQTTKAKFFVKGKAGTHGIKVKGLADNVLSSAKDTGNWDENELVMVRQTLEGRELQEFEIDFANSRQINQDKEILTGSTPSQSRFMIANLKKESDKGGQGHKQAKERFDAAVTNANRIQEGMTTDPYKTSAESLDSLGAPSVFGPRPVPKTLPQRIDDNVAEQRRRGVFGKDVKVLPKETITDANGVNTLGTGELINKFRAANPDQRTQFLDDIVPIYGKHANKAFSQLMADGMPPEAALMVNIKDPLMRGILGSIVDTSTAELKTILKSKGDSFADDMLAATNESVELTDFINSLQPFNSKQKAQLKETIGRLGLQMATNGGSVSEIVNRMESKISRELYIYSGRTHRIRRDAGRNVEKIEQFLAFEKNFNLIKDPNLEAGGVPIDLLQSQVNRAEWYTNGNETGARLYIDGVPILKNLGEGVFVPVEFLYSDIEKTPFRVIFNEDTGSFESTGEAFEVDIFGDDPLELGL